MTSTQFKSSAIMRSTGTGTPCLVLTCINGFLTAIYVFDSLSDFVKTSKQRINSSDVMASRILWIVNCQSQHMMLMIVFYFLCFVYYYKAIYLHLMLTIQQLLNTNQVLHPWSASRFVSIQLFRRQKSDAALTYKVFQSALSCSMVKETLACTGLGCCSCLPSIRLTGLSTISNLDSPQLKEVFSASSVDSSVAPPSLHA